MSFSTFSFYSSPPADDAVNNFVNHCILAGMAIGVIALGLRLWTKPDFLANLLMPEISNEDLSPRL